MKRLIVLLSAVVLVFSLSACGDENNVPDNANSQGGNNQAASSSSTTITTASKDELTTTIKFATTTSKKRTTAKLATTTAKTTTTTKKIATLLYPELENVESSGDIIGQFYEDTSLFKTNVPHAKVKLIEEDYLGIFVKFEDGKGPNVLGINAPIYGLIVEADIDTGKIWSVSILYKKGRLTNSQIKRLNYFAEQMWERNVEASLYDLEIEDFGEVDVFGFED